MMLIDRVLFQGGTDSVLRVSKPGIDVNFADIDQTTLDSRWSGVRFFMSGTCASGNNSVATVSYGVTLANPPILVGVTTYTGGAETFMMLRGGGTDMWNYAHVGKSSFTFQFTAFNNIGTLHYALFERVAG